MPSKPMIDRARRGAFDDICTPAHAVEYLLPCIPEGVIWESAYGTGALASALSGRAVVWGARDYFSWEPPEWDVQVTNPPFSLKAKWLRRANELGKPWALLLPVTALGSRACQEQLAGCEVLFLPRRVEFTGKKAPWFAVAWFTRGFELAYPLSFIAA